VVFVDSGIADSVVLEDELPHILNLSMNDLTSSRTDFAIEGTAKLIINELEKKSHLVLGSCSLVPVPFELLFLPVSGPRRHFLGCGGLDGSAQIQLFRVVGTRKIR
jgi:hypothetical protein